MPTKKNKVKRKVGRPKNRSRAGRPRAINDATIQKLEQAFSFGCTNREACLFADISEAVLYAYFANNPQFSERVEKLKDSVKLHARMNVARSIVEKKNRDDSKWYLERKAKDEFATRTETKHSGHIGSFEQMSDEELDAWIEQNKGDG